MTGLKELLSKEVKNPHLVHKSRDIGDGEELIPGLPDAVALCCLARAPLSSYPLLQRVSKSWKRVLRDSTKEIIRAREELGCSEKWVCFSFSIRPALSCSPSELRLHSQPSSNFFTSFNPGHNTWRRIGYMPGLGPLETLREYACVGLGGKMFVIGGKLCRECKGKELLDVCVRREVYAYDCISGTWQVCASMAIPRVDFACSVSDGKIIVSGGRSLLMRAAGGTATAECYNPESDTWTSLPAMQVARFKCVGVTLGHKVYVIGGYTPSYRPWGDRSSVEVYDCVAGAWEFVQGMWPLDIPPYQVIELQGRLYRSGDQLNEWRGSVDEYDPNLNLWKTLKGSRRRIGGPFAATEADGVSEARRYVTVAGIGTHLLFFGGHCEVTETGTVCFETVDAFEPSTGKWSSLEPLVNQCRVLCSPCGVITA